MIITERLSINKIVQEDFERFYEINSDPETNLFNPHGAMDYETAKKVFSKSIEHWNKYNFGMMSISEKSNPDYKIGFGGLTNRLYGEKIKLNLGFRFDKKYWNKGYATEFAKTIINFGFYELNKNTIFGLVRPKNISSIKVLKKCGMKNIDKLDDVQGKEKSLVFKIDKT